MTTTRQYLLAALLYVREKPKAPKAGICTHVYRYMQRARTNRDYVEKLLHNYIAQWPVVLEEANLAWSPIPFFWEETKLGTLWANPLRHELIERVEEDEKNGTELGSNYSPQAAVD